MFRIFEMHYVNKDISAADIDCIPFDERFIEDYKTSYNEAFHPMREALGIRPYDWYSDLEDIRQLSSDIWLLTEGDELIGSVACYGNEVDDLFVSSKYKGQGYGRKLLYWGMDKIRKSGYKDIVLHVAQWNENACKLYESAEFEITKTEEIG